MNLWNKASSCIQKKNPEGSNEEGVMIMGEEGKKEPLVFFKGFFQLLASLDWQADRQLCNDRPNWA